MPRPSAPHRVRCGAAGPLRRPRRGAEATGRAGGEAPALRILRPGLRGQPRTRERLGRSSWRKAQGAFRTGSVQEHPPLLYKEPPWASLYGGRLGDGADSGTSGVRVRLSTISHRPSARELVASQVSTAFGGGGASRLYWARLRA